MSKQQNIYELGLHESLNREGYRITRVPGGWIYYTQGYEEVSMTSSFVPYSQEFKH